MIYTAKQLEALKLIHGPIPNVLLYGGARSGKTRIILEDMIASCYTHPGVRYIAGRLHLSHAKASLWEDTLQEVLTKYPKKAYVLKESELVFQAGTQHPVGVLYVTGFDDQTRIEKLLGRGANRIYLNEASQLSYDLFLLCKTRLSKKTEGITNKLIIDANPPGQNHWLYKVFIAKQDPITGKPLQNPEDYASLRINPSDNLQNLPDAFMKSLDTLPDYQRARFRDGEFVTPQGSIYTRFNESRVIRRNAQGDYELPPMEKYSVGVDFGLNMAAVLVGWCGDKIYVLDDYSAYGVTTSTFNSELYKRWKDVAGEKQWVAYCDPAGGERLQEIFFSYKADNSVEEGIDYINTAMEQNRFFVLDRCLGVLSEIYNYRRDDRGRPIKEEDHSLDSMRYSIYSEATYNNFSILQR